MKQMKTKITINLLLLFLVSTLFSFSKTSQQPDAKEIVRKADEKMRGNTSITQMTIRIVRPTWNREISLKTWTKNTEYAMIYIASPARDKGTVFLKRNKEVWNWLPSIERNIKLPPSMMSQSWMGTDFTNDDLVREFSILEDYTHKILGEENAGGRACYKIQLTPKPQAAVVWSKIFLWIDKKDYMQMKAEYFDETGALVNTMTGSDIKTIGGRLLPSTMEMVPASKPGNKTVLIYKFIDFDKPIADNFFTAENMKKVK